MISRRWDIVASTLVLLSICVGISLVIYELRPYRQSWPAFNPGAEGEAHWGVNYVANYSMKNVTFQCDAAHEGIRLVILSKGNVNLVVYECRKDGWTAVPQGEKP